MAASDGAARHELLSSALAVARELRTQIRGMLPGIRVMEDELIGVSAAPELDLLKVIIDVSGLGISGYQAADWLRTHRCVDVEQSDHRRIGAQLTIADDSASAELLLTALTALAQAANDLPESPVIDLPSPGDLELETVMLPREAFFAASEDVPIKQAAGRICAEQITPYPPGIPVLLPGERIGQHALDYLSTGVAAGMVLPDPADSQLQHIRVVA